MSAFKFGKFKPLAPGSSFRLWSPADPPVGSTSATVTSRSSPAVPKPRSKVPKLHRISMKARKILQNAPAGISQWHVELISPLFTAFFDTHTALPTKDELDALMIEIRAIPGEENSKDRNVQQWFWHRYSEKACEGAPVEEKANPLFLALHKTRKGFDLQQAWFTQPHRRDLFETWVQRYGDGDPEVERQIRAWIAHTEVRGLPADAITRLEAAAPPPLSVDVSVHDAYGGTSMPTPSDTTSPEPQFPPFASNFRFVSCFPSRVSRKYRRTPYPLPPTPSSHTPSLPPNSEPAASPVIPMHALPSPAPAPYLRALQPLAAPPEVHLLLAAVSHEFTRPQAPAPDPRPPSSSDADTFARLCSALIPFQKVTPLTRDPELMRE